MRTFLENKNQPLYIQLKNTIKEAIVSGNLKSGDKIPSEVMLQKTYNVSRVTVRKAVEELVQENYLIKLQGKGTYVSQVLEFEERKSISSFTELCKMQGKATIAKVLRAELVRGTEEQCEFFRINRGAWVMCIERVRKVDGSPMVLELSFYHPFFEFLKEEDLSGSVYDLLREKYHIFPTNRGLNEVGIVNIKTKEADLLEVKEGIPILTNRVQIYDDKNNPVHEVYQIVRVDKPEVFKYYIN